MNAAIFIVLTLCGICFGGINSVDFDVHSQDAKGFKYSIISAEDSIFGTEQSFFSFNVDMEKKSNSPIYLLLFHRSNFGSAIGKNKRFCCTKEKVITGECKNAGDIYSPYGLNLTRPDGSNYLVSNDGTIILWNNFDLHPNNENNSSTTTFDKVNLNKTGVWYAIFLNCEETDEVVHVHGYFEWKNPFGYLSGGMFPFLPLYFLISISFLILSIVWCVYIIKYRQNLMGLQHCITVVLLVAFLENSLWGFDYLRSNLEGDESVIATVFNIIGALLTASKLTVIRTLILAVALGYSITTVTLERKIKFLVGALTVFYFVSAAANEYLWVVSSEDIEIPFVIEISVGGMVVLCNILYIVWVSTELIKKFRTLKEDKQMAKLTMYKKFTGFLGLFLGVSAVFFLMEFGLSVTGKRDDLWNMWWIFDAYWEVGFFLIALVTAIIWWPNERNQRYAYSTQLTADGEQELGNIALGEEEQVELEENERDSDDEQEQKLENEDKSSDDDSESKV